jgi:hypothetical protein
LVRDGQVVREEIFPSSERLYGQFEIIMMLERCGYRDVRVDDGWRHPPQPFQDDPQVMIVHARIPI